jgi:hypothetical protein
MNFETLKRRSLVGINEPNLISGDKVSDAFFLAIVDMQEDSRCSVADFDFVIATSTKKIVLSDLQYKLVAGDKDFEDAGLYATANALYVDSVYDVGAGGVLNTIYSGYKKDLERGDLADDYVAIEFDKSSMTLFSPIDLTGHTIRVRARFALDYVEGEFAEYYDQSTFSLSRVNLFLSSIPIQFRRHLVHGIRCHLFYDLYVETGRADFKRIWLESEREWKTKILPWISSQADEILSADVHYIPVAASII